MVLVVNGNVRQGISRDANTPLFPQEGVLMGFASYLYLGFKPYFYFA